jgi:hypothetical protein
VPARFLGCGSNKRIRFAKILFWLAAILVEAQQGQKDHDRWLLARAGLRFGDEGAAVVGWAVCDL